MNDSFYPAGDDTFTFIKFLEKELEFIKQKNVIVEIGCGSGEISAFLKNTCKQTLIMSSDINVLALRHTKKKVDTQLLKSDLLLNIAQQKIDIVIFNPPYVETEGIDYDDIRASYSGGLNGRIVIERFIERLVDVKVVYLLIIKKNDPDYVIEKFTKQGYESRIVKVRKIMAETIYIIKAIKH